MKLRIVVLILFVSGIAGFASMYSLWNYYDPYINTSLAITLLLLSYAIFCIGIGSTLLYFIKKVYFRGNIHISNIYHGIRQSFFCGLFPVFYILLVIFSVPVLLPLCVLLLLCIFLELFIQSL